MKLRNKKTGEIIEKYPDKFVINSGEQIKQYNSLTELNEEWEDYEEPKEYWYVSCDGRALKATTDEDEYNEKHISGHKEIGNYFETREEAEEGVEKLKAWKRLKDKGFVFKGINEGDGSIKTGLLKGISLADCEEFFVDMNLLFGDEE